MRLKYFFTFVVISCLSAACGGGSSGSTSGGGTSNDTSSKPACLDLEGACAASNPAGDTSAPAADTPTTGTTTDSTSTASDTSSTSPTTEPASDAPVATQQQADNTQIPITGDVFSVFAADGTFLGFINTNQFDSQSLCDEFGTYGSKFAAKSIWNSFGNYGSDFAKLSPFNQFSSDPPIIFKNNDAYVYLTTNTTKTPRISPSFLLGLLQESGCGVSR